MISVAACRKILLANVWKTDPVSVVLSDATGLYLRKNILAPFNLPAFDQSAMDGFAFALEDISESKPISIAFSIQAGEQHIPELPKGYCARIFTGAPLPSGADTVIKQEDVNRDEHSIRILPGLLPPKGNHIRYAGKQCRQGELVFEAGQKLNPASIGLLTNLGISRVECGKKPRIVIISTGNELIDGKQTLLPGQKYDSNTPLLQAAFHDMGIHTLAYHNRDDFDSLKELIARESENSDMLIVCGGVSVGDFDFTKVATTANDYKTLFHGVNQKPGKPLLFARKENQFLFGLPGNPRAVAIAFYLYLKPFIELMMGAENDYISEFRVELKEALLLSSPRTHFLAAKLIKGKAEVLERQDSHMLMSLAKADIIVETAAGKNHFNKGEELNAFPIF